jgi:hypothetical protein
MTREALTTENKYEQSGLPIYKGQHSFFLNNVRSINALCLGYVYIFTGVSSKIIQRF